MKVNYWVSLENPKHQRNLIVLGFVPFLVFIGILTNDTHQLFWQNIQFNVVDGIAHRQSDYGILFWVFIGYSYLLMTYAMLILVRMSAMNARLQQAQSVWIIGAALAVWIVNVLDIISGSSMIGLDVTPLAFGISGLVLWHIITRYDVLKSTPIARDAVINSMDDGMIVVDRQGLIVDINGATLRLLGLKPEAMLGHRAAEVFRAHPELRDIYNDLKQQNGRERRDEGRLGRYSDGIYFSLTLSDLYARTGDIAGHMLLLQDVSARQLAQISAARRMTELTVLRDIDMRISESLDIDSVLERALESAMGMSGADSGFISLLEDEHQRIVKAAGAYPEQFVQSTFPASLGIVGRVVRTQEPELVIDVNQDPDYYRDIADTYAQMSFPLRLRLRTIGVLNLETASKTAFRTEEFEFMRLLAARIASALENARLYTTTENQLNELRTLYEQVSQLEQLKTDMIRIASHDLRNPLGNLRTYIELLIMDKHLLTDEHRDFVQTMARLGERMEQLITDILSLERFQQQAEAEPIDLCNIARAAITDHSPQAESKSQTFTTRIPDTALLMTGDYAQLREAMVNLITNAIKYTPQGGTIDVSLSCREADNTLIFAVKDTGYGIPADKQSVLFQPFSRVRDENTKTIDGTGLGLHLVKNIIERHHGKILFSSVYGEGSTFGFELPRRMSN